MLRAVFQYFCFPDRPIKGGDILDFNYAYSCRVIRNVWNETFSQLLYHYIFSNGLKFITFSRGPSVVQKGIISGI